MGISEASKSRTLLLDGHKLVLNGLRMIPGGENPAEMTAARRRYIKTSKKAGTRTFFGFIKFAIQNEMADVR